MRNALKALARAVAHGIALPRVLSWRVCSLALGADRALEGSTQAIASIPGVRGQYLRRAFLASAIQYCDPTAAICFGTVFSKCGTIIEQNVYIGPNCHLGLVHLERDVLLAAGVHIPSGQHMHGTSDPDRPIREQPGQVTRVRIGAGTWIGSTAVVLANVGCECVIGAGSVVTKPIPDYSIAAGVPARVLKSRWPGSVATRGGQALSSHL